MDDAVEGAVGVRAALHTLGSQDLEVLDSLGHDLAEETDGDPARRLAANGDVQVHQVRHLILLRLRRSRRFQVGFGGSN